MTTLEFRAWRAHGGDLEYRRWCEVWRLEAEMAEVRQRQEWARQAPPGKHRAVHVKGQAAS